MKKILFALLTSIALHLISSSPVAAATTCGQLATHGKCGTDGGCAADQVCIVGWGWQNGTCQSTAAGTQYVNHCANRATGATKNCGYNSRTHNWCGSAGGCIEGYMCDTSTYTCIKQAACDNTSSEEGKQCGNYWSGTAGQCGPIGACAVGYRCVEDTSSPYGYSCQQKPDANNQMCPGSLIVAPPADTTTNPPADPVTPPNNTPVDPNNPTVPNTDTTTPATFDIFNGPTSQDFKDLNPIQNFADPAAAKYFTSPAGIISRVLLFAFPIAGLILFVMLVWAGFQILAGATQGSKSIEAGRQRATTALVGFMLLFVAYWVMQIIEVIFSITIL